MVSQTGCECSPRAQLENSFHIVIFIVKEGDAIVK